MNHEERELTLARKRISEAYNGESKFSWREVMITVKDPKTYLSGCISFCQDILLYGFSTFLPSIIEAMGHEGFAVQYLTIPVYILGGICFLVFAWFSDKTRTRGPVSLPPLIPRLAPPSKVINSPQFIFFANFFGIAGYIILLTVHNNGIKYFATFLCAIAVYTGPGMNVTWLTVNFAPHYRRATAIGMQQTIGNTAGIVAGQIYRQTPYYLGNGFSLGSLVIAQGLIGVMIVYLKYQDRVKERIKRGEIEDRRKVKDGDRDVDFKYHI